MNQDGGKFAISGHFDLKIWFEMNSQYVWELKRVRKENQMVV